MHCPNEGLEKLEEVSYLLKNKNSVDINQFLKIDGNNHYAKPNN